MRDLEGLSRRKLDLLVIGGGIFGAAATLDAAQRGLDVGLIERGDWCGATSAHSYKIIHGGIRYIQHLDIKRLRRAAKARNAYLRIAPHLVQPLPVIVPTYGHVGPKCRLALRAAMMLYDALTPDRNAGIRDPGRHIPRGCSLERVEIAQRYPGLPQAGLTGAGLFHDAKVYNPPRLLWAFVRDAARLGASVANHVSVLRFVLRGDCVEAVEVEDRLTGARLAIQSRMVLNAAGPYAEPLIEAGLGQSVAPKTPLSRDTFLTIPRPLISGEAMLSIPALVSDINAKLSRGTRHVFLFPWRGSTLIGTWHKHYHGQPGAIAVADSEIGAWLDEINCGYQGLDLNVSDVSHVSAGLVPFGEADEKSEDLSFAHRSRLIDHADCHGINNLLSLIGLKFTMAPVEAVEIVDRVIEKLGPFGAHSRLLETPLSDGDIDDFEALVGEISTSGSIEPAAARALAHNHGRGWRALRHVAPAALWRTLAGSSVLEAEIWQAAREMTHALTDIVFRRTDLGTTGVIEPQALARAGQIMAEVQGWEARRLADELAVVRARLSNALNGRMSFDDGEATPLAATYREDHPNP